MSVFRIVQKKGAAKGDRESVRLSAILEENKCFRSTEKREWPTLSSTADRLGKMRAKITQHTL